MAVANTDEMEEFQRLSDRYRPDVEGPLIGQKLSMTDLVTEYAQADPTYVAKTQTLANTYEAYRRIKGDGQCGWRGTVFGYFELLLNSADIGLIVQEKIRIQTFEDTMKMAGCDYDLLADMFDYTWELFDEIRRAVEKGITDENIVMNVLNTSEKSDAIVYHFKMMTSSHMALCPDGYEPFLEMPLDEYRQARIDPTNQEIDQIGLQALTNGVIAPGGLGLEVLYLDRSAGDEVTAHAFVDDGKSRPTIRLLYRPGHYDIIYKHSKPMTVMLQSSQSGHVANELPQHDDPGMYTYLFPNSATWSAPQAYFQPGSGAYSAGNYQQQYYTAGAGYPAQPFNAVSYDSQSPMYANASYMTSPQEYFTPQQAYAVAGAMQPPKMPPSSLDSSPKSQASAPAPEPQIRFNNNMYRPGYGRQHSLPLDRRKLSNFAQNPNSFCSTDFQPEMWDARSEYNK